MKLLRRMPKCNFHAEFQISCRISNFMPNHAKSCRKENLKNSFATCSSVFDTEWAKIAHSTTQHSDLNAAFTSIQSDMQNGGSLVDLTQFFDPISMDIVLPK